jgi:7-carboxy-7-deazaguanine synthase (Cx14CxxC type)
VSKQYKIKEIHLTIQGEGAQSGMAAVFVRFSGCNLWSGREEDRHKAICKFCDTDFWGTDGENGGSYSATGLADKIASLWAGDFDESRLVVCTGGEPLLQLDSALIEIFQAHGFRVAVETNGTIALPESLDWVCVSPKAGSDVVVNKANEIKIVYPQKGIDPLTYSSFCADYYYIQPMDDPMIKANIQKCIEFCKKHPKWRLSTQVHKFLDIP